MNHQPPADPNPHGTYDGPRAVPLPAPAAARFLINPSTTSNTPALPRRTAQTERPVHAQVPSRNERLRDVAVECARAILRGCDEEVLLNETCRHLVERAGYETAWIGHRNPPDGPLVLLARTGPPLHLDPDVEAPMDDGATRRAITEGRPVVEPDRSNGPSRPEGPEHADGQRVVIPLRLGATLGVLDVHTRDRGFNEDELSLLLEMAADLEHGIAKLQDASRRDRLEDERVEARQQYASFLEDTRTGIFVATPGGSLVTTNSAFARILGYDTSQALQEDHHLSLYTILKPRDKNRLMEHLQDPGPLEFELRRKDASTAWVAILVEPWQTPQGPRIKGFVQDLTPQRARRETRHQLAELASADGVAVVRRDADGTIEHWSPGAQTLYGYTGDEALGSSYLDLLVPPESIPAEQQALERLNGTPPNPNASTFLARRIRNDGEEVDVCVNMSPLPGPGGRPAGSWTIEHELPRTRTPVEPATGSPSRDGPGLLHPDFLDHAAHTLTTRVTPILNHVELARHGGGDGLSPEENLVSIERNAHEVARIARELADASDRSQTHARPDPRVCERGTLEKVIRDAVHVVQPTSDARGVGVETDRPPAWAVRMDRPRLTQALRALLEHVVERTPRGGLVRVRSLRTQEILQVQIENQVSLRETTIVPQEPPEGETSADPRLQLAHRILEAHDGQVFIKSPGGGKAVVTLALPLTPHADGPAAQRVPEPHPRN